MKEQFESTLPRGRWLCAGVALICTIAFKGAIACSFGGLEREVQFPPTSTRLRSEQVISLTNWFIEQKDTRRATHGIYRADIFASPPRSFLYGQPGSIGAWFRAPLESGNASAIWQLFCWACICLEPARCG